MRVTQSMLSKNLLRNISNSYERLGQYQQQLSTGKKVNRPSDDPVVAMLGMEYRTDLSQIKQHNRNLSKVYKWMDSSEAALDQANAVLQRVRELTVQASNDSYDDSQRQNISEEIEELKNHMASIANTKVAGKYIFNGTETKTKPVDLASNTFSTNSDAVKIEVNNGVKVPVNINPTNVFNQQLFQDVDDLQTALENGQPGTVIKDFISEIDGHMNAIISERAELGARYNRVDMIANRVGEQKVIASQILSDNEDIDVEKVIMNLKTQESVHRSALSVGSKIIQPTLLDFLR